MGSPLFDRELSADPVLSEDLLRQRLAYCKARLTDIDNAPRNSRHREDRARVVSQIRRFEAALRRLRELGGKPPSPTVHR